MLALASAIFAGDARAAIPDTGIPTRCETWAEHAAMVARWHTGYYAYTYVRKIVLSPTTCIRLAAPTTSADYALGVYTLAHETGHVRLRTHSERRAECYCLAHWRDYIAVPNAEQRATVAAMHASLPARYKGRCPNPSIEG